MGVSALSVSYSPSSSSPTSARKCSFLGLAITITSHPHSPFESDARSHTKFISLPVFDLFMLSLSCRTFCEHGCSFLALVAAYLCFIRVRVAHSCTMCAYMHLLEVVCEVQAQRCGVRANAPGVKGVRSCRFRIPTSSVRRSTVHNRVRGGGGRRDLTLSGC